MTHVNIGTFNPSLPGPRPLARGLLVAALLCAVGGVGVAQEQAAPRPTIQAVSTPAPVFATPCEDCVVGVGNFAEVSPALWRGAQPSAEGFQALEAKGVKTVINFRHDHDDWPLLKGTKLKYLRIPSRAFRPTEAHLVTFLKVMEDPGNWPVYIHCAQGRDRTGYNAAVYRMFVDHWRASDAISEMNVFHFNKIWFGNPGFLRRLNMEKLKAKLLSEAKPTFLVWPDD